MNNKKHLEILIFLALTATSRLPWPPRRPCTAPGMWSGDHRPFTIHPARSIMTIMSKKRVPGNLN